MRAFLSPACRSAQIFIAGVTGLLIANSGFADEIHFETEIRPLLQQHCVKCHGPETQKSGLRLDAKSFAFRGGDSGAVIVPGKATESELLRRVTSTDEDLKMPPSGDALSVKEIALLTQWLDQGAQWPETDYDREALKDPRLQHWAWQPINVSQVPDLPQSPSLTGRKINPIDGFIVANLLKHNLNLSEQADRRTLIRRLSFDLLGLPPSPERIQQFVEDQDPQAYEKLVDEMLASDHYGERWARHWLDIAHYADTHGFERDQRRDNAWRYRDWVIKALNADLPYDQFLKDQIAGDVLRADDPDAVVATGFLAAGPWDFVGQAETPSPVLKRLARADDLDDMITQVMTSTCAVTINCARCHDHKLDPISQREYYSVSSVFAGVKRGDRLVSLREQQEIAQRKVTIEEKLKVARAELAVLRRDGWNLADIVGGGDGHGAGKPGHAVDPLTGQAMADKRGFLENAPVNTFVRSDLLFVDGVVIPDGGESGDVIISSTGLVAHGVPDTGGRAWDAVRNGPVNSQFSTELGGTDFSKDGHSLLSLHANVAVTLDLQAMRQKGLPDHVLFRTQVGYFGQTPNAGAGIAVFLDGQRVFERSSLGRADGLVDVAIPIVSSIHFLTLMATDGGNDISHDQICFADPQLEPVDDPQTDEHAARVTTLTSAIAELQMQLTSIPEPARVYAAVPETPPVVQVHVRGNPEQPGEEVHPGTISCLSHLTASFGDNSLSEGQRRIALAEWITSPENPLTRRVIVNRLWHHHFGMGLVDTPGDFGLGGSLPSHPELLDWLASQLLDNQWSVKSIHRLICLSATYRQSSHPKNADQSLQAENLDAGNRWLWRQNSRRLDGESVRDAVLSVSGKLNSQMYGPGYRDFEYKEEYAPVYTYITADQPDLWRRSIYRFVVRTTPDQFMATLDCPNAANLTPVRSITTTALQALAMMNNEFILRQAEYLAQRVASEAPASMEEKVHRAFQLALGRKASPTEVAAAVPLLEQHGLPQLCRAMLNANEFVYVD